MRFTNVLLLTAAFVLLSIAAWLLFNFYTPIPV